MTSGTAQGCLVDISYHIRHVAASVTQLVRGFIGTPNLGKGR